MIGRSSARPVLVRAAVAVVGTMIGLLLLASVRGLPSLCPAIFPAPPSCAPDVRALPAEIGTVGLLVLLAAFIASAGLALVGSRPLRGIGVASTRIIGVLLGLVVIASIVWTLSASGFAVDVSLAPAVIGVALGVALAVVLSRPFQRTGAIARAGLED
ncbi:hypothetical protein [Herbiconiux sp. L3-i23]|uniref:hypothetical protein n=1 Tax=Herbiconiux sp. L3-i23 TaxID=2905871 RepID=UPI0020713029|nr:hypothetical protein [Herbiconiux sp. L3-i23]BDI23420.1 hypothetical protein L3i23_21960 [Herbiconiux sp. L3-i23]